MGRMSASCSNSVLSTYGLLEVEPVVARAEPAPGDEVGTRRDRRGRVDLEQCQPLHDREEVRRPGRVEHLGTNRDAPRVLLRQLVHVSRSYAGRFPVRGFSL